MRTMLGVCDEFASEFNVIFNAKKYKCITFNKQNYLVAQAPSRHSVLPRYSEYIALVIMVQSYGT